MTGGSDSQFEHTAGVAPAAKTLLPGDHGFTMLMGPAEVAERELDNAAARAQLTATGERDTSRSDHCKPGGDASHESGGLRISSVVASTPLECCLPEIPIGDIREWNGARLVRSTSGAGDHSKVFESLIQMRCDDWRHCPVDLVIRVLFSAIADEMPLKALHGAGQLRAADLPVVWDKVLLNVGGILGPEPEELKTES